MPLERVNETNAEDVIPDRRDLRISGRRGNHRDLALLTDGGGLERAGRGDLAQHGHYPVPRDQFADDGSRLAGLRLIVFHEQLHFPPQHAARGIEMIHGQQRALV